MEFHTSGDDAMSAAHKTIDVPGGHSLNITRNVTGTAATFTFTIRATVLVLRADVPHPWAASLVRCLRTWKDQVSGAPGCEHDLVDRIVEMCTQRELNFVHSILGWLAVLEMPPHKPHGSARPAPIGGLWQWFCVVPRLGNEWTGTGNVDIDDTMEELVLTPTIITCQEKWFPENVGHIFDGSADMLAKFEVTRGHAAADEVRQLFYKSDVERFRARTLAYLDAGTHNYEAVAEAKKLDDALLKLLKDGEFGGAHAFDAFDQAVCYCAPLLLKLGCFNAVARASCCFDKIIVVEGRQWGLAETQNFSTHLNDLDLYTNLLKAVNAASADGAGDAVFVTEVPTSQPTPNSSLGIWHVWRSVFYDEELIMPVNVSMNTPLGKRVYQNVESVVLFASTCARIKGDTWPPRDAALKEEYGRSTLDGYGTYPKPQNVPKTSVEVFHRRKWVIGVVANNKKAKNAQGNELPSATIRYCAWHQELVWVQQTPTSNWFVGTYCAVSNTVSWRGNINAPLAIENMYEYDTWDRVPMRLMTRTIR